MKRVFTKMIAVAILTLSAGLVMAQTYTYPVKGKQGFSLSEKTRDGMRISYQLGSFSLSQLDYRGEAMSEISIQGIVLPNTAGSPNLPTESRMMAIPTGATATLHVVHYDTETIHNVNLAPALRIQAESEEPDMDYKKDMSVYGKDAFYPENPFVMGDSYIRGVDAVTVAITPFQYNPVTKDLVVYTNIELSVTYEGGNGHFGDDRLRSPYWDPILAAELMNYDQLPVIDYEARMQQWIRDGEEGAEYIIVTPNNDNWAPYAEQLKEFRMKQGIITEVVRLDEMPATTTATMKAWFHNAYNTWPIAPVAVCLLGDHGSNMGQYIPAEVTSHPSNGSCITDNMYADPSGDNLPDIVFSRLIAETADQLPVFVGKQIEYEYTNPNMNESFYTSPITALGWQTERWFQLCSEVFGGYMRTKGYNPNRINCVYSGTPGNVWSSNQNTSMVVNYFGPNGKGYIPATPTELGGWTGGTPEQVVQAVNQGSFWLQHRDHGLETGWGEPAVRNSHVAQMNNVGKLTFVMSINCLTGKFNYSSDCFAEAWMRRTYNGQNAGAVGLLCPTETSYSFVNDAYVWGVYDLFNPDFAPEYGPYSVNNGNWMPAFGNVAGKYFLYESSWPYNTESKGITYTMFTAHCDAFLRIYTQVPQTMNVSHQDVQLAGLQTFQITAPEGTTIALTKGEGEDIEIVAVATATGSIQNLEIPVQLPPTVLHLTVTGQDYLRYEANIDVIPASGPYVIINDYELTNQATQLNFGDESGFNLEFKNVGSDPAPAGTATLTSDSEYVTITNGTVSFEAIDPDATLNIEEAFGFTVSNEVPNKTSIDFLVTINSGDATYESHISMKAYAPTFKIGNVSIQEENGNGNGRLDPGETARLVFPIENKGNADSHEAEVTLTMNNAFLQIIGDATVTINGITVNGTEEIEFQVYVGNAPSGYAAQYTLDIASGVYTDTKDFVSKIGLNVEDFELGTLDPTMWTNNSPTPWFLSNQNPYEGNYCLKSGAISHSSETAVTLTYEVSETDTIAFYYKVSSESGYDKLYFYIDNIEKNNWSGTIGWTRAQYAVSAGTHTFQWKYKKDSSVSSGDDCAWIDFIILPRDMSMAASAGLDIYICDNSNEAQIAGYAVNYQSLLWTTSGDGTFDDATIADPIYFPGTQDIQNGSVDLTITATGSDNSTITDVMTVFIQENVTIDQGLFDVYYCATDSPQEIAVVVNGDYTSFTWSTPGDGVFENASDPATTYTPGPNDIADGFVLLTATAQSTGCGTVAFAYDFEMIPMPAMTLADPSIEICEGEHAVMNFSMNGSVGTISVEPEFTFTMNGTTYNAVEGNNSLDLGALEPGEHVFSISNVQNTQCGVDYETGELTFTVTVNVAPAMVVVDVPATVCAGEEANITFAFTGTAPYTIVVEGMDDFTADSDDFTLTLTPDANIDATLTSMTDANGCVTVLDEALFILVVPTDVAPLIEGDTELDVRLTPTTEYTIGNGIIVDYSLTPDEAGSLAPANDGLSVQVIWSETYRGEAVLTATSNSECNSMESAVTILVRNSTGVDELANNAKVYPNPTSEKVNIECLGMTHVAIYNAMGQMVYNAEVNADKVSVNTAQFQAGSYVIRITTNEGSFAKKLNVK